MALIECPECSHMISNKANSCPHCGFAPRRVNTALSVINDVIHKVALALKEKIEAVRENSRRLADQRVSSLIQPTASETSETMSELLDEAHGVDLQVQGEQHQQNQLKTSDSEVIVIVDDQQPSIKTDKRVKPSAIGTGGLRKSNKKKIKKKLWLLDGQIFSLLRVNGKGWLLVSLIIGVIILAVMGSLMHSRNVQRNEFTNAYELIRSEYKSVNPGDYGISSIERADKLFFGVFVLQKTNHQQTLGMVLGERLSDFNRHSEVVINNIGLLKAMADDEKNIKAVQRKIIDLSNELREVENKGRARSFYIKRQFDRDSQGMKYYEAFDSESYEKCVVASSEDDVHVSYSPISLRVINVGTEPVSVTKSNAFRSYETTEYLTVYRTVGSSDEARKISREISQLNQQENEIWRSRSENLSSLKEAVIHLNRLGDLMPEIEVRK